MPYYQLHGLAYWVIQNSQELLKHSHILLSSYFVSKNIKIRIYNATILPVVLYGCETLSLTLMKEHRLRVFEDSVLKEI
jgi:hypothetical protein